MILPARYSVRDYLKQQQKRLAAFSEDETRALLRNYRERYTKQRVASDCLHSMANEYVDYLRGVGGFSIVSNYTSPTRISPHRERALVSGYVLEPITLGQGWADGQSQIYAENAVLLRCRTLDDLAAVLGISDAA